MSGTRTQKTADEIPVEDNCRQFLQGDQYERLGENLFLDFSANNGNKDVPIWDYFGFVHALHLPLAVFRDSFSLRIFKN